MGKLINPFTDWGFKRLFGREESKPVMIDLLNSILTDDRKIVDIQYDNKEQTPEGADNRTVIYDIYCTTSDNRHIIVEMQYGKQWYFKERTIFYVTRSIEQGGKTGKWDYQFDEVLMIGFMRFEDGNISGKLRTDVMLTDIETNEVFSNRLRFIYLQLPLAESMKEADCVTDLDCWIYNLNNMDKLDELAFKDRKPIFNDLEKMAGLRFMTWDENVAYQRALKRMWDYDAVMEGERKYAREQGIQQGMERGIQQGMKQGIQQGMEQGVKQEKLLIAANLKKMGLSLENIMLATGLTKEQVEAL